MLIEASSKKIPLIGIAALTSVPVINSSLSFPNRHVQIGNVNWYKRFILTDKKNHSKAFLVCIEHHELQETLVF